MPITELKQKEQKEELSVCWHGTSKKAAENILKEGFNKGTYFSKHLEDALGFGGNYVFAVVFETKEVKDFWWQFVCKDIISPELIISFKYYECKTIKENKDLMRKVFESNID